MSKALRKEIYKHEYDLSERFPEKPSMEADLSEEIDYTYRLLESIERGVEQSENRKIKEFAMNDDRNITGIEVTDGSEPDGQQLPKLKKKSRKNGVKIAEVIGDMAYVSDENLDVCEKSDVILYAKTNTAVAAVANAELEEGFSYSKDGHMWYRHFQLVCDKLFLHGLRTLSGGLPSELHFVG